MGVRSDIRVQNVQKILFDADKGRSYKTSRSYNRGSLVAGTTVLTEYWSFHQRAAICQVALVDPLGAAKHDDHESMKLW